MKMRCQQVKGSCKLHHMNEQKSDKNGLCTDYQKTDREKTMQALLLTVSLKVHSVNLEIRIFLHITNN